MSPTSPTSKSSRKRGQSSRRFTEVVSLGPTSIPDNVQVVAALSDARATEESRSRDLQQERQVNADPLIYQVPLAAAAVNDRQTTVAHEPMTSRRVAEPPVRGTGDAPANSASDQEHNGDAEHDAEASGGGLLDWALTPVRSVIGAVKWAGASVNDVAVAPVMRLANPSSIAGSLLTTLKAYTPQRARDLARVAGNVVVNFAGLTRTPAGSELLCSTGRAAGSLSKAVSSPAGRQFAVDYASGFVKLAEALNTPEVKAAIQQGTIVMARGMDLLADRQSKMFLQDMANVLVRVIELANSKEATVLVAELTANIVHALEMEQVAGTDQLGEDCDPADVLDAGVRIAGAEVGAEPSGSSTVGELPAIGANVLRAAVDDEDDNPGDRMRGGDAGCREVDIPAAQPISSSVGGNDSDGRVQVNGSSALDVPVPLAQNTSATRSRGNTETQGEEGNVANRLTATHAAGDRDNESDSSAGQSTDGMSHEESRKKLDDVRVISTPITQADLNANTRLRITRGRAAHKDGVGRRVNAETPRSAPSSPTGRRDSIRAAATSASGPPADSGPEARVHRPRAHSTTGLEYGASDPSVPIGPTSMEGNTNDREQQEREPAELCDGSEHGGSEHGGSEHVLAQGDDNSARAPAKYARDGHHFLPRFTGESFASLLRRPPESLERLLEPPTRAAFERALSSATRRSRDAMIPGRDREGENGAIDSLLETRHEARSLDSAEDSRSMEPPGDLEVATSANNPAGRGGGSWLQLCFAVMFIGFAIDGFVHRAVRLVRSGYRGESSSGSDKDDSSRFTFYNGLESDPSSNARPNLERRSYSSFLPPNCRNPVSGANMLIWVTPAGACLAPGENMASMTGRDKRGGISETGGAGPTCARSFRMCSAAETVGGMEWDIGPIYDDSDGECAGAEHSGETSCRKMDSDELNGA